MATFYLLKINDITGELEEIQVDTSGIGGGGSGVATAMTCTATNGSGGAIAPFTAVTMYNNAGVSSFRKADLSVNDYFRGFTGPGASVVNGATATIYLGGVISGFASLSPGSYYWLDATATAGTITTTPSSTFTDAKQRVGFAVSNTDLLILPMPGVARVGRTGFVDIPEDSTTPVAVLSGHTTGGNSRGVNASDLQQSRTAVTQVASGGYSFVVGKDNTASAISTVAAGAGNTAAANYAVTIGKDNVSTGVSGVAIGASSGATANYATAIGLNALATRFGEVAHSSGKFSSAGDMLASELTWFGTTTSAATIELFLDGGALPARCVIPNGHITHFEGWVLALDATTPQRCYWQIYGMVDRRTGGNVILYEYNKNSFPPIVPTGWNCDFDADATNQSLILLVTGPASLTLKWASRLNLLEIG